MNEDYIFEVSEVTKSRNLIEVKGLAFDTIKLNDCLSTTLIGPPQIKVVDIITYEHHVDELVRGLTGKIILTYMDDDVDLRNTKHLYKVDG